MAGLNFPISAERLARFFDAQLIGDPRLEITELRGLKDARAGSLSFFANRAYASTLDRLEGVAVLTRAELVRPGLPITFLVVPNPQEAFAKAVQSQASEIAWRGISPLAYVSPSAVLGEEVVVGPFSTIGDGAYVGRGTVIYSRVTIGSDTRIGENCILREGVTLYERTRIGDRVKIHAGAVIGSEGFGYFSGTATGHTEMPQVGRVVIEDDVRIGANATIDRATLEETRIRRGAKIDNLVHIGHNCAIGEDVLICAQVGIGGSCVVERGAVLAGQVGVGHGVHIGEGARLGGQTGASTNIAAGESVYLTPSLPLRESLRIVKYWRKLPEIWSRLKKLEAAMGVSEDA